MSNIRNIAIIAHVDHWKTTLVDALLTQSWTIKKLEDQNLVMDSNDQERERWITIYSKNTSITYKKDWEEFVINIIDTPWHADFWSEVERVLKMVDSVLLVVDAYEWPMPQTKFVLKKSLELWLKPIVVINKIDKPTARPERVINEVFDLFITLWATDEQADFGVIYASAKEWYAFDDMSKFEQAKQEKNIKPIFDLIISKVPQAEDFSNKPFRMQIVNLWYDDFVWRLWIGRIYEWNVKLWQDVEIINNEWKKRKWKISKLYKTIWLSKIEIKQAECWDIITIAWISDIFVWETIWDLWIEKWFDPIHIDPPTLTMDFLVNDSPFAWREWKYVTSNNIQERLEKELETNVWLQVDFDKWWNRFSVSGRWELHISVLIETMRREWYELQVSAPEVIMKKENWKLMEPIEQVIITVDEWLSGTIINMLAERKWQMVNMNTYHWITTIEFEVPTRWLLWFRAEFTLTTKWEWIMYNSFLKYEKHKWEIKKRTVWSMISQENWKAMRYSIWKLQDRWTIFVEPASEMYEWMIVWESAKPWDMTINLTKNKQQSNMRTSGNDENMLLKPIKKLSLEDALSYIWQDEYVEITPKNIRLRKIYLKENERKKHRNI